MRSDNFPDRSEDLTQRERGTAVLRDIGVLVRVHPAAEVEVRTGEETEVIVREDAELEHGHGHGL